MKTLIRCSLLLLVSLLLTACKESPTNPKAGDSKADAKQSSLSPEDQKLADEQGFCVVNDDHRLGEMGTPVKVMVDDQPVFVCCKSCLTEAQRNPDKTLAKVKELKEKTAAGGTK